MHWTTDYFLHFLKTLLTVRIVLRKYLTESVLTHVVSIFCGNLRGISLQLLCLSYFFRLLFLFCIFCQGIWLLWPIYWSIIRILNFLRYWLRFLLLWLLLLLNFGHWRLTLFVVCWFWFVMFLFWTILLLFFRLLLLPIQDPLNFLLNQFGTVIIFPFDCYFFSFFKIWQMRPNFF